MLFRSTPGLDQPFLVDELFHLHASPADYTQANSYSRLRRLLPFNLENNLKAQQIRQRFTTSSWDRSEHSQTWSADPRLAWEFNADLDGDGLLNEVGEPVGSFGPTGRYQTASENETGLDMMLQMVSE